MRKRIENVSAQSASILTFLVAIVAVTATAIAGGGGLHLESLGNPGLFWAFGGPAVFLLIGAASTAMWVRAPTPRTALGEVRASRTFRLPSHPPMSRGEEKQPGV